MARRTSTTEPEEPLGMGEMPLDFDIDAGDLDPRAIRIANQAARLAAENALNRIPIPPHNSGRISNGWGPWMRWAIGLALTALGAVVVGWMSLHSDIAAMQQAQLDMRAQVNQMYDWLAPRYRGGAANGQ